VIVTLEGTTTSAIQRRLVEIREEGGVLALGRVLTLVIHTHLGEEEDAIAAANEASREHPMRVLVVSRSIDEIAASEEPRLDAEIRVGGDAGASEVVLLQCYGEVGAHLIGVVQGLLLPDAPVVAWWPHRMPEHPASAQLGAIAQRRITDSARQEDPRSVLRALAEGYEPGDTDLAWTRITNWRAQLAAVLDQPPYEPVLHARVTGALRSPSVHLMAAWLRLRLDVDVDVSSRADGPLGSSGLSSVTLTRASGDATLTRVRPSTGLLQIPGQPDHEVALSHRQLRDQLAEELRRLDPDEMYHRVLEAIRISGTAGTSVPAPEGGSR